MAYIQPNSTVQFFGDIGLSPNYENTLYFSSVSAKDTYFDNLTKLATATALSYSRETRGFIRVEKTMAQLIGAGYMRFKNTSFENKWFYAFVKSVEYINNTTTQVNFELDVMMTWMGVFTLKQCYVERQHSLTDAIGGNIIDEDLNIGEYTYFNSVTSGYLDDANDYYVVVCTSLNRTGDDYPNYYIPYDGIYSGSALYFFDMHDLSTGGGLEQLNTFFDNVNKNEYWDAVVSVFMVPKAFIDSGHSYLDVQPINKPGVNDNLWGFTVQNKKLYTYPYVLLRCTNCEGDSQDYRFEFFSTSTCQFRMLRNALPPVQLELYPKNYKGVEHNVQEALSMANMPTGAFVSDSYKAFLAQARSNGLVKLFTTPLSMGEGAARGAMFGGGAGAVIGAVGGAIGGVSEATKTYYQPDIEKIANKISGRSERAGHGCSQKGTPTVGVFHANNRKDFYFNTLQITSQYAKIIDDYFTMYGYAQRKIMYPNMNARPHWTYVKTIGCTLDGNLPADDAAQIEQIFDNGIRFWKDHTKIGLYGNYNNSPT